MEMDIKKKLIAAVVVVVVVVGVLIYVFTGRPSSDVRGADVAAPPPTAEVEHGHIPEGWVPEGKARPTPPAPNKRAECTDGNCGGEEGLGALPEYIDQWTPVATGFANNFGATQGKSAQQWLNDLRPFTRADLVAKMETIAPENLKAGSQPEVTMTNAEGRQVIVRADYPEGWTIYIELELMGMEAGWKVVKYDTPRFR